MSNYAKHDSKDIYGDDLEFYKNMFPNATPFAQNGETEHPLEDVFRGLYGTSFFFVYEPLNFYPPKKTDENSFVFVLMPNTLLFKGIVGHFFDVAGDLNRMKVKAFGRIDCLMKAEDKEKRFSEYKDTVNLVFKDKNPRLEKRNNCEASLSYLYKNGKIVETPNLFRLDPETREKTILNGNF